MTAVVSILLCAVIILHKEFLELPIQYDWTIWQLELFLVALLGVISGDTQREKSMQITFVLWFAWIVCTDPFIDQLPVLILAYENVFWCCVVFWAMARPYITPSQDRDPTKVAIAFYHGNNAPLISSLSALIGLPFASIAILAGNTAIRPAHGRLALINAKAYDNNENYTIINTHIEADKDFFKVVASSVGNKTTVGPLRAGCIVSMRKILDGIGLKPKTVFHHIPSIYYYQVAGTAHDRQYSIR